MGWAELALRVFALAVGASVFWAVSRTVLGRLRYPFELEWMEGAMVDHVVRVLDGRPIYVEPTAEFVPYIYPPLYFWLSAGVAHFAGASLPTLRAVAIVAFGVSLVVLFDFVRRESRSWLGAFTAVALYTATFSATEFWFGLARVDTLMIALVLGACWLVRFREGLLTGALAGLLLAAACFAKQQALGLALAPIAYAVLSSWRRGVVLVATAALVGGLVTLVVNHGTEGWFLYYVYLVPRQHDWRYNEWYRFLLEYFWNRVGIHGVFAVVALALPVTTGRGRPLAAFYGTLWLTSTLSGYASMLHTDGWLNVLLPAYVVYSLLAGIAVGWCWNLRDEGARARSLIVCHVAVLVAFGLLYVRHRELRPSSSDALAVRVALQRLSALPGPVFCPGTGHYPFLAGQRPSSAHEMAIRDILKTKDEAIKRRLLEDIETKLREHRFGVVLLGGSSHVVPLRPLIEREYVRVGNLFEDDYGLPRAGMRVRPDEIWVPRGSPTPPVLLPGPEPPPPGP